MQLIALLTLLTGSPEALVQPAPAPEVRFFLSDEDVARYQRARLEKPNLLMAAWVEEQNQESEALMAVEVALAVTSGLLFVKAHQHRNEFLGGFAEAMGGVFLGGIVLPIVGLIDAADIGEVELEAR